MNGYMERINEIELPSFGSTTDYGLENPVVIAWTDFFLKITDEKKIFSEIVSLKKPTKSYATAVGCYWTEFSRYVPGFLIKSASMLSDNAKRVHFVRIAYEELGEGKPNEIHCDLFEKTMASVGISNFARKQFIHEKFEMRSIEFLDAALSQAQSDSEIIGLGLGLEAPAFENIETIYRALRWSKQHEVSVDESLFFKIHRVVEVEHIRLNVENFLKFCKSDQDKQDFLKGFLTTLEFWSMFWTDASRSIVESYQEQKSEETVCG